MCEGEALVIVVFSFHLDLHDVWVLKERIPFGFTTHAVKGIRWVIVTSSLSLLSLSLLSSSLSKSSQMDTEKFRKMLEKKFTI